LLIPLLIAALNAAKAKLASRCGEPAALNAATAALIA
jgi:hypothetical protein